MDPTRKVSAVIVLNGISFYKKSFYKNFLPAISEHLEVEIFETKSKDDGLALSAKAAAANRFDLILAAGGDGTLHQVVNGVVKGSNGDLSRLPVVGLIPMGSGNDFARTANLTYDAAQLIRLLKPFQPKEINLGKIVYNDFSNKVNERYFINVADIGMGPEVVKRVSESPRALGGAFAYYKSILATFLSYKTMVVHASTSDWSWQGKLRSLAVANGKYYGHGICIAPDAHPDDDLLNIFICGNCSVFDFIRHSETMKKGKHVRIPEISYKEATTIKLTSVGQCLIEGDGEILGKLPATVSLSDTKIKFLMP